MILSLVAAVVMTSTGPSAANLAPRFVQVQDALPAQQPTFDGWTREQLETELRRLDETRPSLAGPVTLMAVGGAVGVIDLVVFLFGGFIVTVTNTRFDTGIIIGMSLAAVIAAGLLIVGGILLRGISKDRSEVGRQMDLVKEAIERLTPTRVEPPPNVPPAMPFPQQVMGPAPLIAVTLARF